MDRHGYWNKILHVSLGDGRTWVEEPGDRFFRRYAGGRGFIAHYLLTQVPKGADPLGPDNILVFAPGWGPTTSWCSLPAWSRAPPSRALAGTASVPSRRSRAASASRSPAATGAPSSSARAGTRSSSTACRRRPSTSGSMTAPSSFAMPGPSGGVSRARSRRRSSRSSATRASASPRSGRPARTSCASPASPTI
ncbi:MAG: hypothetical protein HYU42_02135 [Candidatus Rokubacteria bacterium]|nr:hypothetical protein [Candidatus Rokubacteria bacterium]